MKTIKKMSREMTSLRAQVTENLRSAILDGRLVAGEKLVERELCESLEISRTLLRESLQELRSEGLISSIPHKGPSVNDVDIDEINEIYAVRVVLESLIGKSFVLNATDKQVRELRLQMEGLKNPEVLNTSREILQAKAGFYNILYKGCGNETAVRFLKQLNNKMFLFKSMTLSSSGRPIKMARELDAVVSAIEAREPELTADLFAIHVSNAARTMRDRIKENQENEDGCEVQTVAKTKVKKVKLVK